MGESLKNKILLITGGTGSFGNAILNKLINYDFKEIRIFSRDEDKQNDLRIRLNNPKVKFYIGDVRDRKSIDQSMKNVDFIIHAAALKQVPSCELFPLEAIKTNILGTENVIDSAINHNVKKVICLSTDKSVYPINTMGMTKALMEKLMIAKSRLNNKTILCCTRYGNVIGTRGSVIPLFLNQIKQGKELTITNQYMTRFLMNLDDAIKLVLYVIKKGKQGDIFIQKSPATTIEIIAKALINLCGTNNKIKIIGIRHGEKLHETLINEEEMLRTENLGQYFRIPMDDRGLNYEQYHSIGQKKEMESYTSQNTKQLNIEETKKILLKWLKLV